MLNNIQKNSECRFAEQVVSYLYGETTASDNVKFETHLKSCAQCSDDLTGFGIMRSNILDWKTEKFSGLETPTFIIPQIKSRELTVVSEENNSWFNKLTGLFQLKPALAAFAVLIVMVGAFYFSINFTNKNVIVADNSVPVANEPVATPAVETTEYKPEIKSEQSPKSIVSKFEPVESLPKKEISINPKPILVKSPVVVKNNSDKYSVAVNETFGKSKKNTPARKQTIPDFEDFDEDVDETLRLLDLLEDVDTE